MSCLLEQADKLKDYMEKKESEAFCPAFVRHAWHMSLHVSAMMWRLWGDE